MRHPAGARPVLGSSPDAATGSRRPDSRHPHIQQMSESLADLGVRATQLPPDHPKRRARPHQPPDLQLLSAIDIRPAMTTPSTQSEEVLRRPPETTRPACLRSSRTCGSDPTATSSPSPFTRTTRPLAGSTARWTSSRPVSAMATSSSWCCRRGRDHRRVSADEIRLIEGRRGHGAGVRELHLRDALRTGANRTLDKPDSPSA